MNKRGFGFPSIFVVFVLILVVVILAAKQGGIDETNINTTINSFNWTHYGENVSTSIQRAEVGQPYWVATCLEIANKGIDFFGYSLFAVGKMAMEIARDNPNVINYRVLLAIILISLLAVPLYYLFLSIVVITLLIREWVLNRREKKELSKYGQGLEG